MKSFFRIIFIIFSLLFVSLTCYLVVVDNRNTSYVGNIKNNDPKHQLLYKQYASPFYDNQYKYLFINDSDTTYISIELDSLLKSSLVVIDSSFNNGVLYSLEEPLKGFKAYRFYEGELSYKYLMITDYIYIPNSLYSIELTPLLQNSSIAGTLHDLRGLPKEIKHKWLLEEYLYPYEELDSILYSKRRLPSFGADCLLFTHDSHPSIRLLYKKEGFSDETRHIIQYPVILLSNKQFQEDSLYKLNKKCIGYLRKELKFRRPYALMKYSNGYLFFVSDSPRLQIPTTLLLDSLIHISNTFIKEYLNIPKTGRNDMPYTE